VMARPTPTSADPLPTAAKLALGVEIVVTYARARRLLRRRGLPAAVAILRSSHTEVASKAAPTASLAAVRLGRAVTRALGPLPSGSRCLVRSLVLTSVLARRGIESSLVIGVRPAEEFGAHAWVEHDGRPLLPMGVTREGEAMFQRLVEV